MDRSWYIDECHRQLNNPTFYEQQDNDKTDTIQRRVTEYVKRMFNDKLTDKKTKQYLIQREPRPGRFYILPKSHKVNNPGRPIVSSNNHPTERISQFVDFHLKPIVSTVPSYVKDTTDFLNKLANFNRLPDNAILVTLDVTSLYTNIPHNEGIEACRFFLHKRNDKHIPTETICDLIRIILNMNIFTFNDKHLQKHGTAMGTKMAPSFANLFLAKFEHDALNNAPYQPHTWLRFLDDIFVIWIEGSDKLTIFVDITYTPPSSSLVHIPLLMSHSLMSWFHSRMVLYTLIFTLNPLTNISIYLSLHVIPPTPNAPFHIVLHFASVAYAPTRTLTDNVLRNS